MDDTRISILRGELAHARNEYRRTVAVIRQLEIYVVAITGLVWGWWLDVSNQAFAVLVWFPPVVALLFGLRAKGYSSYLDQVREYARDIEGRLESDAIRWTSHLDEAKEKKDLRFHTGRIFWFVMIPGTFAVAIYLSFLR